MGVKGVGATSMTRNEIRKLIKQKMKDECEHIYENDGIMRFRIPYSAKATSYPMKTFHPEMEMEGFNHKYHGNIVVPDYRIYDVKKVAIYSSDLRKYMAKLDKEELHDPWLRNHIWDQDPYSGYETTGWGYFFVLTRGMGLGLALAVLHICLKHFYEGYYPPHEYCTDKWWEARETPKPNNIYNRFQPEGVIMGLPFSKNPELKRYIGEDVGVDLPPPKDYSFREKKC